MGTTTENDDRAPPAVTLSLYVQRPVAGRRTVAIDRLSALEVAGAIEEYEIQTVDDTRLLSQAEAVDVDDELEAVATWHRGDLTAAVDVETESTRMGRSVLTMNTPELLLAVRAESELVAVFPCTDGSETWTATEFLDSYEASRTAPAGTDLSLGVA